MSENEDWVIISILGAVSLGLILYIIYLMQLLMQQQKDMQQEKDKLYYKLSEEVKKQKDFELKALNLKNSLEKCKLEYLHPTKQLFARGALEVFQKRYVFKNKAKNKSPREMWDLFLEEELGKSIKQKLLDAKCETPVGKIAARVYKAVSVGIHNYFDEGLRKVYLVRSELHKCDLLFLEAICAALPINPSDIVVLDKTQFLYSPPKKN